MSYDLNKLIGVPFKLNKKDFSGCDCRGIVWLYYRYVKNTILPFTDGKRVFLRNRRKDYERMDNIIKTFAKPILFNELDEGDIVFLKNCKSVGVLGVCINKQFILHMDKIVGSCLTRIRYLENLFLAAYRPL